ncbi:TonB-dependent receptor [Fulvivirgaceae bacterium BMA12]|uniref:TonB-dependent receptor n=1 Tax=Agaribacillus aureus TaxID=3051825 RepID=A0ABT8L676_9BACT|nr:TonB-dependent receptor [Fulvivirgaceae bacterium BMA12]
MKCKILPQIIAMSRYSLYGIILQCFLVGLVLAETGNAQNKSLREIYVNIKLENVSIGDAFAVISEKTNFKFAYDPGEINFDEQINVHAENQSMDYLLRSISRSTGLWFKRINENIFVDKPPFKTKNQNPVVEDTILDKEITGKVTDANEEPLPGVNVLVKGTTIGAVTDVDGIYRLMVPEDATILTFSSIGYVSEDIEINNQTVINVALVLDVKHLSEVVVIGYGTVNKRDLTGSVTSVSSETLKDLPATTFDQMLAGRAPGLQVTQASSAPGGSVSIRIRGSNSVRGGNEPLIVVDGFPIYNNDSELTSGIVYAGGAGTPPNTLSSINPNDIESIEILKDASATAIYGARGANGVIMITTKRGKSGRTQIDFDAYYGVQEVANKIDMLNASQYADLVREARENSGLSTDFDLPTNINTDWQDEIFRAAAIQDYNLGLRGGDDKTKFALSANYFEQEGIVRGSDLRRVSLRLNLDREINEKLTIGTSLLASRIDDNVTITDRDQGAVGAALKMAPNQVPIDENGIYPRNVFPNTGISEMTNPLYITDAIEFKRNTNRVLANLFGEYKIVEGLTYRLNLGADIADNKEKYFAPRNGDTGKNDAIVSQNNNISLLIENTLTYKKTFGDQHHFTALIGQTAQTYERENLQVIAENLSNDTRVFDLDGNTRIQNNMTSGYNEWNLASYLSRVNYSFNGKYLATASIRVDGSSRFGRDNKFGVFPSGSVAWVISEEPFMAGQDLMDLVKLRVSYGTTGNQEIGTGLSLGILNNSRAVLNNDLALGKKPRQIPNPDLSWESTEQFDIGVDLSFWKGRIQATLDYYIKTTNDLLYTLQIPNTTGFSTIVSNIGSMENKGFELDINTHNLAGAFEWNTNFNLSMNRNKLLDLGGQVTEFVETTRNVTAIAMVGEPLGNFYGYEVAGIFQQGEDIAGSPQPQAAPGDRKYVDQNADGVINSLDRTIVGNSLPDVIFGLNNTFSYKGFDLAIFIQGMQGFDVYNRTLNTTLSLNGQVNNTTRALDRWTPQNPNTNVPRALQNRVDPSVNPQRSVLGDFIEDGSFIRISNFTLGYNLPSDMLDRLKIQKVRVYLGAQNLATFTDYSGYDPEVNSFGQNNVIQGVDDFTYPRARTYLAGLNVTF